MSYTYLQEQGGGSSVESFSDIPLSVLSKLKSTRGTFSCKDNGTDCCPGSQSGMTSLPLTESHGQDLLISSVVDFPAKTSQRPEEGLGSKGSAVASGKKWREWFAKYDQDSCSWKTPQCSLLGDLEPYSETWPKWGTMRNGVCSEQTMPEHLIDGNGYGSLRMIPTPTCSDAFTSNLKSTQQKPHTMHSVSLAQLCEKMPEKMWPTPRSRDWKDSMGTVPPSRVLNPGQATLGQQVAIGMKESYPTPCVTSMGSGSGNCEKVNKLFENGQINDDERRSMRSGNDGQLNPDWVEWLMCWPIRWTRMKPTELDWRDWAVDPADDGEIPRVGFDIDKRKDRLTAIGNGQVPAVAALAFTILLERLTYEEFGKEVNNGKE